MAAGEGGNPRSRSYSSKRPRIIGAKWLNSLSLTHRELSFNRQMAWAHASSTVGKKVPLRRVDILRRWPDDLKRVKRPDYTPVFILVDKGREVGRFAGYSSPQGFTRNLQRLLNRL